MTLGQTEKQLEKEFHVSWYIIAYKFILGCIELVLGLGIAFFGKQAIVVYNTIASRELSEDPHDLLVNLTSGFIPHLLTHNTSLIIYLILLGSAKILGSVGLIYKKNWGVDLLVFLTIVLFPFQAISLMIHPGLPEALYMVLGICIALYLIEFRPKAWISKMLLHVRTWRDK